MHGLATFRTYLRKLLAQMLISKSVKEPPTMENKYFRKPQTKVMGVEKSLQMTQNCSHLLEICPADVLESGDKP